MRQTNQIRQTISDRVNEHLQKKADEKSRDLLSKDQEREFREREMLGTTSSYLDKMTKHLAHLKVNGISLDRYAARIDALNTLYDTVIAGNEKRSHNGDWTYPTSLDV